MELLAKGEVDIGLTFISEDHHRTRRRRVGSLPRDISTPTAVDLCFRHSKEPEAAKALLRIRPCRGRRGLQATRNAAGSLSGLQSHSGATHHTPPWLR